MKVIGINGAPRVGKDTLAKELIEQWMDISDSHIGYIVKLKDSLLRSINLEYLLGVNFLVTPYDEVKDQEPKLRDLMIAFSEKVIKPVMGKSFLVDKLIEQIAPIESLLDNKEAKVLVVIPDLGFIIELENLLSKFKDDFCSVNLRRDGYSYPKNYTYMLHCELEFNNLELSDIPNTTKTILNHIKGN